MTTVPLRRVARVVPGGTPTPDDKNWGGDIAWATPVDVGHVDGGALSSTERTLTTSGLLSGSKSVPEGSLLLSTRAPIGYVARTTTSMAFNQGCKGLVLTPRIDPRFLQYELWSSRTELQSLGTGSTFTELSTDSLLSFPIHVPKLTLQQRIADFLDDQVARIDEIVRLREQQAAALTDRLSARLDELLSSPYVGNDELLQRLTDRSRPIQYGIVLPGPDVEGGVPIIKGGDIGAGRLSLSELKRTTPEIDAQHARSRVRAGDLVIAIRGSVGEVAVVPEELTGANLTQDSARIAPSKCDPAWLHAIIETPTVQQRMDRVITGATVRGINIGELRRIRIPIPPDRATERALGEAATELRQATEDATSLMRAQIDLLRERKRSLITAAVTGEFDVSSASGRGVA